MVDRNVQKYVVGFALCPGPGIAPRVVLIRKKRPEWQANKLNGVGGKIEEGESPVAAMVREFFEETSVVTQESNWRLLVKLTTAQSQVSVFVANLTYELEKNVRTTTDEFITIRRADQLVWYECVPNLRWLVPLASLAHTLTRPALVDEVNDSAVES